MLVLRRAGARAAAARTLSASAAPAPVGMGHTSDAIEGVSHAQLFKAMMLKVDQPDRFLPVSQVSVRLATDPAAAEEGALWRSMVFDGALIREHIYASKADGEVRFVGLDEAGLREGDLEIVNALRRDPLRIEYYQRHLVTKARMHWAAPVANAASAIATTVALARRAEEAAARGDAFSPKA